jgi:hypothetical protein
MADLVLQGPQLPFVLGGAGTLTLAAGSRAVGRPLPPGTETVFDVQAKGAGNQPLTIGAPGSWSVGLTAGGSATLTAIWRTSAALARQYGLEAYFAEHPDDVVLVFTAGASADGRFAGKMRYAALTASATLEAGSDLSLTYMRGCDAAPPLKDLVTGFFGHVRLPAALDGPPAPGEMLRFQYGGYLQLGGSLGVGYEVKGTPSIDLGGLRLSERYGLSVIGKLGLQAQVGGFFSVEIKADETPGWARVTVRKTRAREFTCAADASVKATSTLKGLPESPNELLGAMVGVNVRNWLNLLDHVRTMTGWGDVASGLDALAIDYLSAWLGKEFSALTGTDFADALARVQRVADQAGTLDTTVVAALDRYFDHVTNPALGGEVAAALEKLAHLPSWDALQGDVNPVVWTLVGDLTDGDPLGWILEKGVGALQKRASDLIALGRSIATTDLGAAIRLAKEKFGLNPLLEGLKAIDTVPKLQAQAGKTLGAFVERLLGDDLRTLQESELGQALARVDGVLKSVDDFETRVYAKLLDVAKQKATFDLHAEYGRASDDEALVDLAIDAATPEGLALLRAAAVGDFQAALADYRPGRVRIFQGRLTRTLVTRSTLDVNVIGWHDKWRFKALDRVIVHADQQILPEPGGLTVYSIVDLTQQHDRETTLRKSRERVSTNFLLRFLGESHGVIARDADNEAYLIDTIARLRARYQLGFEDDRTTAGELAYYLGFARDFGIADAALAPGAIDALLPPVAQDDYGPVTASYDVRYDEAGLLHLFDRPFDEALVRRAIRTVVLTSYVQHPGPTADLGWAYWTPAIYGQWKAAYPAFAASSSREFATAPSPLATVVEPARVVLSPLQQQVLGRLYEIEDDLTAGMRRLDELVRAARAGGPPISPRDFERALDRIGNGLDVLDNAARSVDATFAVFDALAAAAGARRAASLTLKSKVGRRTVTKVFLSASGQAGG